MSVRGTRPVLEDTYIATEAISRYAAVVANGSGYVKKPTAARANVIGIAQEAATASGDAIKVMQIGKSLVIAGASASAGGVIAVHDTVGRVSTPTTWASGDGVIGYYDEAPTASGDHVVAIINPHFNFA
jgi:hypothetical protein